jgi:hypothetical protein
MKPLAELIHDAYTNSASKGWHEQPLLWYEHGKKHIDHNTVLAKHALIHSELTEMRDSLRIRELPMYHDGAKPEGWLVEAADILIRVFDLVGALELPLDAVIRHDADGGDWLLHARGLQPANEIREAFAAEAHNLVAMLWIGKVRCSVDRATEAARVDNWDEHVGHMATLVLNVVSICFGLGHDIGPAIDAKMEYNATRPHRHGGKRA